MTLSDTAPGKLVNLLSNDVNRFEVLSVFNCTVVHKTNKKLSDFFLYFSSYTVNSLWTSPLSAVIATYFLYVETGLAGMVGLMIIMIVAPLQSNYTPRRRTVNSFSSIEIRAFLFVLHACRLCG